MSFDLSQEYRAAKLGLQGWYQCVSDPTGVFAMEQQTFTIATSAFDATLLPAQARTPGTPAFREAVIVFLQQQFQDFRGRATILVDDQRIAVSWSPDPARPTPMDVIVGKLHRGQKAGVIQLMEILLSRYPDDLELLSNLGIALSDTGKLDAAERHLRRVVELAPRFANGLSALGVALSRQQKSTEAVEVLASAVELEPENSWPRRNYGVTLLKLGRHAEAIKQLKRAVALQPDDQRAWVALGDALRLSGETKAAKSAYSQAIALSPHNDFAEVARLGSAQLAQATPKSRLS